MQRWEYSVVFSTTSLELDKLTDAELWKMVESLPEEAPAGLEANQALYKTVSMRQHFADTRPTVIENVAQTINDLGKEGWELVSITNTSLNSTYVTTYYLKRPIE